VGEYREWLFDFTIAQGVEIEFKEPIAPALGRSYGGRTALLPGQGTAEEFSTWSTNSRTRCSTEPTAGVLPPRPCARPKPRRLH